MVVMQAPVCKEQTIILFFKVKSIHCVVQTYFHENTQLSEHTRVFELNSIFYWDHYMDNYLTEQKKLIAGL